MRKTIAPLAAAAMLVLAGCGHNSNHSGSSSDARSKGEAAIDAIKLPANWRQIDQRFYAAGMQRSENEWDRVWHIDDAATTVNDAKPVFESAATAAGWTKLGEGHWTKSPYWMNASLTDVRCGQQSECVELSLTVIDVKPPWGSQP